jgi:hypothetical protein
MRQFGNLTIHHSKFNIQNFLHSKFPLDIYFPITYIISCKISRIDTISLTEEKICCRGFKDCNTLVLQQQATRRAYYELGAEHRRGDFCIDDDNWGCLRRLG